MNPSCIVWDQVCTWSHFVLYLSIILSFETYNISKVLKIRNIRREEDGEDTLLHIGSL